MNMMQVAHAAPVGSRAWRAQLSLGLELRGNKTALIDNRHYGPLRVQRPFYPELIDCCHIYLLHPPGGIVVGDLLEVSINLGEGTGALVTTPSAGKIYGVQGASTVQQQKVNLQVAAGACLEWLPQETIAYSGANGRLNTRLQLQGDARACLWDIVCLGRPAAGETFAEGRCDQTLEVWRDEQLLLLERNRFAGGDALLVAPWGLKGCNTCATLLATVNPSREQVDELVQQLRTMMPEGAHHWGLTQKGELFVVRYIGNSGMLARRGLQHVWSAIRPLLNGSESVSPRIWNT